MGLGKILLVGAKIPAPLMESLLDSGYHVKRIATGNGAVAKAQREMFDAAIIVSTGHGMDVAETIFNLSDINKTMQFIIISDAATVGEPEISTRSLERVVRNTTVMNLEELQSYLASQPKQA
jgi:DNA-binding response OmpR family regulator